MNSPTNRYQRWLPTLIAVGGLLLAPSTMAEQASLTTQATATLAADQLTTVPDQEQTVTYHGVHGFQLDTNDASVSVARRILVSRKREDARSATLIDYGNGVQLSGTNERLSVTPRRRTGREQNVYGFDYANKELVGSDNIVDTFNESISARLRAASGGSRDASWSTTFTLSELVEAPLSDATVTLNIEREFVTHNGNEYVLIGYNVPAFAYTDLAANTVVHWASGFVITDPDYSVVYFYGARNQGTQNAATPQASPLSARMYSYATTDSGERLLDLTGFDQAKALIDQAVEGAMEYPQVSRAARSKELYDTGFFAVSRMIDIAASAVGENSANQTTEHADGLWDQAEDVGNTATRAAQGNNALSVFRGITNLSGSYYTKQQLEQFDNIYSKLYDGEKLSGWGELWTDTTKSGGQYVSSFFEYAEETKLARTEVYEWFDDARSGIVKYEGAGAHLARLFGDTPKEVVATLGRLGIHGAEGVSKIAGPIAWMASAYTISQGFSSQDPLAPDPQLIGSASSDYLSVSPGGVVLSAPQFFDRVILDVGFGLALDLATGDLIGFGLDTGAVVVKSIADPAEAWTYYRNSVDEVALSEATFLEIYGTNYKSTKPFVDTNLPPLLDAESNRTGQDWSWLVDEGTDASSRSDWEDLQARSDVLFTWEIVDATGSLSNEAANKITENNFRRAMLGWLEKRNPNPILNPPEQTLTEVDPPIPNDPGNPGQPGTPSEPNDPGPTGTVTTSTAPTRTQDPGSTGTVTTTTAPTGSRDPGATGTVSSTTASGPTPANKPEDGAPSPNEWHDARDGWHNEYRYDKDGNWIGYTPVYPLGQRNPRTEGDAYNSLFDDVAAAAQIAEAEQRAYEEALKDPYSPESVAKRKAESQAALDAKYEADRKAKGLPPLDTFDDPKEREAYYQGQLDARYEAERKAKGLPSLDTFTSAAEREAYYRGVQNAALEADRKAKGLPPLDAFENAEERQAYYSGILQAEYEADRKSKGLPPLDDFDDADKRQAYYQGQLDAQYAKDRSDKGLPPLDTFESAQEREAYYEARLEATQKAATEDLPPLDQYTNPEERQAAAKAWLDEYQKRKLEARNEPSEEPADKSRLLTISPLPGGDYPNQVDFGDGSYPNQLEIDWSKFNSLGKYPNQVDYGDGSYPNTVELDWTQWDATGNYPNQVPNDWFSTPYDSDSFAKFTRNNAFKYGNMFGMIPTNLPDYEDFIAYYGLDELNRMARNAGYPNIFAAIEDQDYLIALAKNPGFRTKAMNFECNVRFGVNYDCIGLNRQERGQLELGDLLQEGRAFASDGFSDVSIAGLILSIFLSDFGLEDGDIVNLSVTQFGRSLINKDISLTNAGTRESTRVRPGVVEVEVTALNTGEVPPNTAAVVIENVSNGESEQDFGQDTGGSSTLKVKVGGGG